VKIENGCNRVVKGNLEGDSCEQFKKKIALRQKEWYTPVLVLKLL